MKFNELFDKMFKSKEGKKRSTNLIFLLGIGILLILLSLYLRDENPINSTLNVIDKDLTTQEQVVEDVGSQLEKKLENILCKIKGVGNIQVMITLDETTEKIPAINKTRTVENTSEKDSEGGTRQTNREDTIDEIVTKSSEDGLVILKEIKPAVKGVIVVAQGVEDIRVKEDIYLAVKTVLGIAGNKVEVFLSE